MSTCLATFLPLSSLKSFSAALRFLDWLVAHHSHAWLQAPIAPPLSSPYKNDGIGIAPNLFSLEQLLLLRQKAQERHIMLIGDLPFYVARQSPLVAAHPDAFLLDDHIVSGIVAPPGDAFGAQIWGHPLYNWQHHAALVLEIFKERIAFLAQFYDMIRLDHADGFFHYGAMNLRSIDQSTTLPGPGASALLEVINYARSQHLEVFLDDIGADTADLRRVMDQHHLLGTNILTLASRENPSLLDISSYQAHKVAFSSTHDTPPLFAWLKTLPPDLKHQLIAINHLPANLDDFGLTTALCAQLARSAAPLVIIPWQDWHFETWRFNTPGDESASNWGRKVDF